MSTWLRLISDLKRRVSPELLSPTQRQVWEVLYRSLQFPQWLNLYGPSGSGKTLVAWAIARTTGAIHVPIPERLHLLSPEQDILLIDNASAEEDDVRRLLATCNLLDARSVVLITRTPVAMPMRRVELCLPTPIEVEMALLNISRLGYYPERHLTFPLNCNYWAILQYCI